MSSLRGLILTPDAQVGYRSFTGGGPSKQSVIKGLLYWDRLVVPRDGLVKFEGWEEAYLLETGKLSEWVLPRPLELPFGMSLSGVGRSNPDAIRETQKIIQSASSHDIGARDILRPIQKCFEEKSIILGENWIVDFSQSGLKFDRDSKLFLGEPSQVFGLELRDCLPIPEGDFPLEDLLRFREARNDEFDLLMIKLEEYYQDWINSADPGHQLELTRTKLCKSISDGQKVTRESDLPFGLGSMQFDFQINLTAVPMALMAGKLLEPWQAALGVFAATCSWKNKPPISDDLRPFQVLSDLSLKKF